MIISSAPTGTAQRNGHTMARQMLSCERSPTVNECQAPSMPTAMKKIMVGKNSTR